MKNRFAKQVLSGVAVRLCAAHPPKYSEILEMDRVVREFDMKPIDHSPGSSQAVDDHAVFVRHSALVMFRDLGTYMFNAVCFHSSSDSERRSTSVHPP